jgi:hypothetical protein
MSKKFPQKVGNNVYPRPEYRYPDVKIGLTHKDSVADFPQPLQAPDGAPNILLVILDDVGFGWPSAFGGLIEMPTAERLAEDGLRYNQFHTCALCSPTRAALLTGRNHHSAHSGVIGELATGFPGYDGIIPKVAPPSPNCSARTVTPPAGGARTTTYPTTRPARLAPSTTGLPTRALTISMASSAAKPTSSCRHCTGARVLCLYPIPLKKATTWTSIWRTTASTGCAARKPSHPIAPSWRTSQPVLPMPPTSPR